MQQTSRGPLPRARLIGLIVVMALVPAALLPARGGSETMATVTVVGRGEVTAEPDQAVVTVGVQLYDESARQASAEMRRRMDAVIAALVAMGIPERRIQTMNYSIFFERDYQAPAMVRAGEGLPAGIYRVENMVRILISDVTRAAEVVEAAVAAGANQMYGIEFSFSEPETLDARARSLAMADARARADAFAAAGGKSLGEVLEISEVIGRPAAAPQMRTMADGYGAGPIQPGTMHYSAGVQVTYRLQ